MKYITKNILLILFVGTLLSSCNESDNAVDYLMENVDDSGVILRTTSSPSQYINLSNDNINKIEISLEVQEGDGDHMPDFKEVRLSIGLYEDLALQIPLVDADGNEIAEKLIATYLSSDFSVGVNDLPVIDISMPTQDMYDTFPGAQYVTPTYTEVSLEIEMTDGRIYNSSTVGSIATNTYFMSPYRYLLKYYNN